MVNQAVSLKHLSYNNCLFPQHIGRPWVEHRMIINGCVALATAKQQNSKSGIDGYLGNQQIKLFCG